MDAALKQMQMAKALSDKDEKTKAQKDKLMEASRAALEEARTHFQQAAEKFAAQLAALPAPKPSGSGHEAPSRRPRSRRPAVIDKRTKDLLAKRADIADDLINCHYQLARVDFCLAQTMDPNAAERKELLRTASKNFDAIWQSHRITAEGVVDTKGLYAHMMDGRCRDEVDDWQTAGDIYDEVLGNSDPKDAGKDKTFDALYQEVQHYRLMIVAKHKPDDYVDEATQWLTDYKKVAGTDGYQGILLELGKYYLANAEKASGAEKETLTKKGRQVLREMLKVPSSHHQEADDLLGGGGEKVATASVGNPEDASTIEDAVSMGQQAVVNAQWKTAVLAYQRAFTLADKLTPKQRKDKGDFVEGLHEPYADAMYYAAVEQFQTKEAKESSYAVCFKMIDKIIESEPKSKAAPKAALLRCSIKLNAYFAVPAESKEARDKAMAELVENASFLEKTWEGAPAADDARMILAQAYISQNNIDEAIKILDRISKKSAKFSIALHNAGQAYWRRYVLELKKPDAGRNKKQMESDRGLAAQRIHDSLALQQEARTAANDDKKPLSKQLVETQLLMGEILLEGKNAKDATALLQPLIDQIKSETKVETKDETKTESKGEAKTEAKEDAKGEAKAEAKETSPENKPPAADIDLTTLRIFVSGVKAYLEIGDLVKAGEAACVLADVSPDQAMANSALGTFSDLFDKYRKSGETKLKAAREANNAIETSAAEARIEASRTALINLLKKLALRKRFAVPNLMHFAELLAELGLATESNKLYEDVLKMCEGTNNPKAAQYRDAIQARVIDQLRKESKYERAVEVADDLIKAHPNALEPKMAKGRVLQEWSEKDPSHLDAAVELWLELRNFLAPSLKRPADPRKIPDWQKIQDQYYDAIYNAAEGRFKQAQMSLKGSDKTKAVAKATEGAQLLYGQLIQSEKLNGKQEMVDKYQDLLKKLRLIISGPSAGKK
jgi:hypothetical protein